MNVLSVARLVGLSCLIAATPAWAESEHMNAPSSATTATYSSVTITDLQSVATKYKLATKLERTASGVPFLAIPTSDGQVLALIQGLGCEQGKCQGFTIYSVVKEGALLGAIVRKYNSSSSYTRLVEHEDRLLFEQQSLVAGGVSELNIASSLSVFLKNMKLLTDLSAGKMADLSVLSSSARSITDSAKSSFDLGAVVDGLRAEATVFAIGSDLEAKMGALADEKARNSAPGNPDE